LNDKWTGKKLLVFVNPFGGSGTGSSIWFNQVKPVFEKHSIACEVVETKYRGFAASYIQMNDVLQYQGIVIVGGDGSIHEVFNGLYKRPDSEQALKIPIGVIPGGTSNGLAFSLGVSTPVAAAEMIAEGNVIPFDIFRAQIGDSIDKVGCLSLAWGLVADHDMLSERDLRWLGGLRLVILPIYLIAKHAIYNGKISYLPLESESNDENSWKSTETDCVCFVACNVAWLASDICFAPKAGLCDGSIDMVFTKSGCSRFKVFDLFSRLKDGSHVSDPEINYIKAKAFKIEPIDAEKGAFVVDGEAMDEYKTLTVTSMPGAARLFQTKK